KIILLLVMHLHLLLAIAALATALHPPCGVSTFKPDLSVGIQTGNAITKGHEANPYSWPWQVIVCENDWFSNCHFKCTGTIIGEKWVLTAASCFNDDGLDFWNVRAGLQHENQKGFPEQLINVKSIYKHPS
ncbi:hypothetical protein PFISCL1PPCAC_17865, partial [Pristionchus fissidentatus]